MFDINVVAPEFKGLNTVKQHRIINEVKQLYFMSVENKIITIKITFYVINSFHKQFAGSQGGNQRYAWSSNTYKCFTIVNCDMTTLCCVSFPRAILKY